MNRKSKTINLMKYIIIGLGNYGHVLAEELSALGHEVIGADISSSRVDGLKDKIATAFVIDATDEQALSVLPLNSVDVVIVAIGENFGASIRVDANYYVVKFTVPERFIGYSVNELKLDKEFGLKLLALKRAETLKNCLGISFTEHDVVNGLPDDDLIQAGDRLVCYGQYRDFRKFWKAL